MILAIYVRWEMVDYQSFPTLKESLAYLDRNRDYGDLYPICVFDMEADQICHKYQWPNGAEMTDEDLQPYIEHVKSLAIPRYGMLQQIKDANRDQWW